MNPSRSSASTLSNKRTGVTGVTPGLSPVSGQQMVDECAKLGRKTADWGRIPLISGAHSLIWTPGPFAKTNAVGCIMMNLPVRVSVDFPALDRLTQYLEKRFAWEQSNDQAKIDALTAQVQSLTEGLHKTNAELQGSMPPK